MLHRATARAVAAPKTKDRQAKLHYITRRAQNAKVPFFTSHLFLIQWCDCFGNLCVETTQHDGRNAVYRVRKFQLVQNLYTW